MQAEAAAAKAEGAVGVQLHEGNHGWKSHATEFFSVGTAVLPIGEKISPDKIPAPVMVLPIND